MILIFDYFETIVHNKSMDFNRGLKGKFGLVQTLEKLNQTVNSLRWLLHQFFPIIQMLQKKT